MRKKRHVAISRIYLMRRRFTYPLVVWSFCPSLLPLPWHGTSMFKSRMPTRLVTKHGGKKQNDRKFLPGELFGTSHSSFLISICYSSIRIADPNASR
ncbi:hypothetical protein FGIG_10095 [Fasciola gigantica]|uniref:Uncharacterized protein n=1 Tax=Fasciola gigantica TaxID=46835 RepID=A0A504YFE7_FASGI|nr:hypothetical protein FGIG_10095 [Fasciola gigantica]